MRVVVIDRAAAAAVLAGVLLVLFLQVEPYQASGRPLMDREVDGMLKELKSSLQRGPVPPSGSSGCTHVPGSNGPGCPSLVNQMNFAGSVHRNNNRALHHQHQHHHSTVSSSYPVVMIPFGLADRRQQ